MGHLNPLLTIARRLKSQGHTVVFVYDGPPKIHEIISASDFDVITIRAWPFKLVALLLPYTSGFTETFIALKSFMGGLKHYGHTVGQVLDRIKPDVVVADFAFPGVFLAAESRVVPYVMVYHAGLLYEGPGIPPFGSGLPIGENWGRKGNLYQWLFDLLERNISDNYTRARRKLSIQTGDKMLLSSFSSPWLTLALTTEASELPMRKIPSTTFFVGPCVENRPHSSNSDFPFDALSEALPKIYVSLGTVFNRKPKVFTKIIEAFLDNRYQLIVSAGGAYEKLSSLNLPSNILLFKSVPQLEILPLVDVVISHGGNNTTNETLAAGKPLLVMPVGGEQGDNASRVAYLGAGLRASIKSSTSHEIREKIDRLIKEPQFKQRASEIASAIALTQGTVIATQFIEHIARTKRPLVRTEGYPLTVTRDTAPPWQLS